LDLTFESSELGTLAAFKQALTSRGYDYALIQQSRTASLILDIANASESQLLKEVVDDRGLFFSLWKVSDAYLESAGERRKQFRELLKQLFFWANCSATQKQWPDHFVVRQHLFHRERTHPRLRPQCAEALALSLEKVTRELRSFSVVAKVSTRESLWHVIRENEACLQEAAFLKQKTSTFERLFGRKFHDKDDAQKIDLLTLKLATTLKSAVIYLQEVVHVFKPAAACQARRIIREGETVLIEVLPKPVQIPTRVHVGIFLFDVTLYLLRLFIGFWIMPIVWLLHPRPRAESAPLVASEEFHDLQAELETPAS
jgi:hypothetical protein